MSISDRVRVIDPRSGRCLEESSVARWLWNFVATQLNALKDISDEEKDFIQRRMLRSFREHRYIGWTLEQRFKAFQCIYRRMVEGDEFHFVKELIISAEYIDRLASGASKIGIVIDLFAESTRLSKEVTTRLAGLERVLESIYRGSLSLEREPSDGSVIDSERIAMLARYMDKRIQRKLNNGRLYEKAGISEFLSSYRLTHAEWLQCMTSPTISYGVLVSSIQKAGMKKSEMLRLTNFDIRNSRFNCTVAQSYCENFKVARFLNEFELNEDEFNYFMTHDGLIQNFEMINELLRNKEDLRDFLMLGLSRSNRAMMV